MGALGAPLKRGPPSRGKKVPEIPLSLFGGWGKTGPILVFGGGKILFLFFLLFLGNSPGDFEKGTPLWFKPPGPGVPGAFDFPLVWSQSFNLGPGVGEFARDNGGNHPSARTLFFLLFPNPGAKGWVFLNFFPPPNKKNFSFFSKF